MVRVVTGWIVTIALSGLARRGDNTLDDSIATLKGLGFDVDTARIAGFSSLITYDISAQQRLSTAIDFEALGLRVSSLFQESRIEMGVEFLAEHHPDYVARPDDSNTHAIAWCNANGYTDPFFQESKWWAFPPNGVMPVTICL